MLDVKIVNGTIMDGTGAAGYRADLGIEGDKIVAIGDLKDSEAKKVLDAAGKIVCPGFIDFHTHSDLSILYDSFTRSRIHTGITTDVVGNCGIGVAPIREEKKQLLLDYLATRIVGTIPAPLELHWSTMKEYLDYVDQNPPAVNVVPLLAQGAIRIDEMGFSDKPATEEEIKNMRGQVKKAMDEGAFCLTSGLIYLPGAYTSKEELAELCKELDKFGGYYCTHMRDEGDTIDDALDEAIYIAKEGGCPLHVSHLKVMGSQNWGRIDHIFEKLEQAEKDGVETSWDVYPYTAGMTSLTALLPPWVFEGGVKNLVERIKSQDVRERIKKDIDTGLPKWQNMFKMSSGWQDVVIASVMGEENKALEGKSIQQISEEQGKDPFDVVFDTIIAENGKVQIVIEVMSEEDVLKVVKHPKTMIGSDSMDLSTEGLLSVGKPHPRAFGTVGRIFNHYVKEIGALTFEDAIRKMTFLPAKRLGLTDRGILKENCFADVVVFDPETIADKATYGDPKQYTVGIEDVIVNGQIAFENGVQTDVLAGRVIRNPRSTKI